MNKWFLLCFTCFSVTAMALEPVYFGVQTGYADNNFNIRNFNALVNGETTSISTAIIKDHVFTTRAYCGYQFNDFLALEAGYINFKKSRIIQINDGASPNGNVALVSFDIRSKLLLPMTPFLNWTPYMQVGAMSTHANASASITNAGSSSEGFSSTIRTVVALGLSYNFNQNFSLDTSWTKIMPGHSKFPRAELYLLGLTYHFDFGPDNNTDNNNYNGLI